MVLDLSFPSSSEVAAFFQQSADMDLSSQVNYFHRLFPYAERMPANIYLIEAASGHILGCNEHTWKIFNFSCADEIINKTVGNIGVHLNWPEKLVKTYRETDLKILEAGSGY